MAFKFKFLNWPLSIFILGMTINIHSDKILLDISREKKGYQIPHGGFYKWISSPNYFGEMIEWIGWAIMTWSLSGFVFALWTIFNLLPRALKHHHGIKINLVIIQKTEKL